MRVFMTGSSGVLGRAAIRELCARGHEVVGLVRSPERAAVVQELGAMPVVADLFDLDSLKRAVEGCDTVMHLATAIPKKRFATASDWAINDRIRREGTKNLIEASRGQKLNSFILQSVAFVYGDRRGDWIREQEPTSASPTTRSAIEAENMVLAAFDEFGLPATVLRGASFYGPDCWHTQMMVSSVRHRLYPVVGSGEQYWHYIHVRDMAAACALAAEYPAPGEVFHVADDWPFHAKELIYYLASELHAAVPFAMSVTMANIVTGGQAARLAQSARYRTDKIKKVLGWAPRYPTYRDGFLEILNPQLASSRP